MRAPCFAVQRWAASVVMVADNGMTHLGTVLEKAQKLDEATVLEPRSPGAYDLRPL